MVLLLGEPGSYCKAGTCNVPEEANSCRSSRVEKYTVRVDTCYVPACLLFNRRPLFISWRQPSVSLHAWVSFATKDYNSLTKPLLRVKKM